MSQERYSFAKALHLNYKFNCHVASPDIGFVH